jgi:hypothetical protein
MHSLNVVHMQTNMPLNTTGTTVPPSLPSSVTMHEGLVVKGNVFVNCHLDGHDPKYAMGLGLDPCYGSGLPCDKPPVRARAQHGTARGHLTQQAELQHYTFRRNSALLADNQAEQHQRSSSAEAV